MAKRQRLYDELVEQGFFATTDEALRAIMAGEVSTSDRRLTSAGQKVERGLPLHVKGHGSYVSRGGLKLERGLDHFGVDPTGLACLDVGCSTGGFTDCLLRRGASSVLSVDVGYAQFDWALRQDARVTLMERTNIVDVPAAVGASCVDLAVCDVSFTSVTTVLPAVMELLRPHGAFLTLVKPQFEAGREKVGKNGVVRDPAVHREVLHNAMSYAAENGFVVRGLDYSPVKGPEGNIEYLMFVQKSDQPAVLDDEAAAQVVAASHTTLDR